jgi:3-hydroxyacyl-CoA dehydrogenase
MIKQLGVVGAGQMGVGIAFVASMAKKQVILVDQSPKQLEKARKFISTCFLI